MYFKFKKSQEQESQVRINSSRRNGAHKMSHFNLYSKLKIFFAISIFIGLLFVVGCAPERAGGSDAQLSSGTIQLDRNLNLSASDVAQSGDLLTIAVRYLAMQDVSGAPVTDVNSVEGMLAYMSDIWKQCEISFHLENFEVINPSEHGLSYNPNSFSEIDLIRTKSKSERDLLIVGTGPWGRTGNLGTSNCYSSFPGDLADGIVCEKRTATSATLVSHEVGHWFYLKHTNDGQASTDGVEDTNNYNVSYNLMDHFVSRSNRELTRGQCERARMSVAEYRKNAVLLN